MIEKLLAERRIKKYYKSKYHHNFENELDPEDDQEQLYQFYYQTFAKYQAEPENAPVTPFITANNSLRPSRAQILSNSRQRQ